MRCERDPFAGPDGPQLWHVTGDSLPPPPSGLGCFKSPSEHHAWATDRIWWMIHRWPLLDPTAES